MSVVVDAARVHSAVSGVSAIYFADVTSWYVTMVRILSYRWSSTGALRIMFFLSRMRGNYFKMTRTGYVVR